jgi:hypothetical protein
MIVNFTKIAVGTCLLGVGGVGGVLLAPQDTPRERTTTSAPVVLRTVHVKHVHRRTIHEKPHRVQAAPVHVAVAPVRQVVAAPPPAPAQHPLRTRTSGSGGSGSGDDHEHESSDD